MLFFRVTQISKAKNFQKLIFLIAISQGQFLFLTLNSKEELIFDLQYSKRILISQTLDSMVAMPISMRLNSKEMLFSLVQYSKRTLSLIRPNSVVIVRNS